jgi:hypothetical protein
MDFFRATFHLSRRFRSRLRTRGDRRDRDSAAKRAGLPNEQRSGSGFRGAGEAGDEEVVYAVEGTRLRREQSLRALAIAKPCQSLLK